MSAWEKELVGFVQLLMQECKTMMLLLWNPARPLLPAASSKVRDVFGTSNFLCFRWEILTQQAGTFQSKLCLWISGVSVRVSEGEAFPPQCFGQLCCCRKKAEPLGSPPAGQYFQPVVKSFSCQMLKLRNGTGGGEGSQEHCEV